MLVTDAVSNKKTNPTLTIGSKLATNLNISYKVYNKKKNTYPGFDFGRKILRMVTSDYSVAISTCRKWHTKQRKCNRPC